MSTKRKPLAYQKVRISAHKSRIHQLGKGSFTQSLTTDACTGTSALPQPGNRP